MRYIEPKDTRLPYIKLFQSLGHKIDFRLLSECAYYPQAGCQDCRWDWPLADCPRAHILVDTRMTPLAGWVGKRRKESSPSLERLLSTLSVEALEELRRILKG